MECISRNFLVSFMLSHSQVYFKLVNALCFCKVASVFRVPFPSAPHFHHNFFAQHVIAAGGVPHISSWLHLLSLSSHFSFCSYQAIYSCFTLVNIFSGFRRWGKQQKIHHLFFFASRIVCWWDLKQDFNVEYQMVKCFMLLCFLLCGECMRAPDSFIHSGIGGVLVFGAVFPSMIRLDGLPRACFLACLRIRKVISHFSAD